jgi:hypothetical protein
VMQRLLLQTSSPSWIRWDHFNCLHSLGWLISIPGGRSGRLCWLDRSLRAWSIYRIYLVCSKYHYECICFVLVQPFLDWMSYYTIVCVVVSVVIVCAMFVSSSQNGVYCWTTDI